MSKWKEIETYTESKSIQEKFTPDMIGKLKKAYGPMKGKRIAPEPLMKIFDKIDKDKNALIQLYKADIPFVSQMAVSRLISKHKMKGAEINKLREDAPTNNASSGAVDMNPTGLSMKKKKELDARTKEYKIHARKLMAQREKRKLKAQKSICGSFRKGVEESLNSFSREEFIGEVIKEAPKMKDYKYEPNFFVNDKKDTLDKLMKDPRDGYDATELSNYLAQKSGKNPDDVYFDDDELVHGSKTVMRGAHKQPIVKLIAKLKTIREELDNSLASQTMRVISQTSIKEKIDPADVDDVATADDRKAADKNIIIQLRRAQDMQGKADVTFKDKPSKKEKIDIRVINKALDMFDKMRPNDKAKMQTMIGKSYRDLLKTVQRGRIWNTLTQKRTVLKKQSQRL